MLRSTFFILLVLLNAFPGSLGNANSSLNDGLTNDRGFHFQENAAVLVAYTLPGPTPSDHLSLIKASFPFTTGFDLLKGRELNRIIAIEAVSKTVCIAFKTTDIIFPFHSFT